MLYLGMNNKNIITQTNRTILFEEINPEKPDLITLIDDVKGMDSLSLSQKFTVITILLHKI